MEDISADTVPQQRRDPHAARRERQARALEIIQSIGRPPGPTAIPPRPERERPAPKPEVGEVYFLYSCNRIKIGTSKNHLQRVLNEIVPYCPAPLFLIGTIPGGRILEGSLHTRFRLSWAHSEWFELWPELREFLCEDCDRARALKAAEENYSEWLDDERSTQLEKTND